MTWMRVTACDNIPPREGRAVSLRGRAIAIFNTGDRFLAVDNHCPHRAGPLADGIISGTSVVCPLHTWKISLLDGRVERPSASCDAGVTAYPTRVENGVIAVLMAEVAAGGDNGPTIIQNCQSEDRLLHERRLTPPCPYADGCVSSNPESPGA
jgi:nitrite reductase (NADH) small subunit